MKADARRWSSLTYLWWYVGLCTVSPQSGWLLDYQQMLRSIGKLTGRYAKLMPHRDGIDEAD